MLLLYRNGCTDQADLTYAMLYYREIDSKSKGTPSGTLSQTLDLENFATAHQSSASVI